MDIRSSIVGIFAKTSSRYKFSGTGFFVEGRLILTCAHVAGRDKKLGEQVFFQFEGREAILTATIEFYSSEDELDIAVLKPSSLPNDMTPLPLAESKASRGHKFSVFGYPQKGKFLGLHGAGDILGLVKDKNGREELQFSSSQVTYGYSGGPIMDETCQMVVGMVRGGLEISLNLSNKLGDTGFAVSTETLKAVYPALEVGIPNSQQQETAKTGWFFGHQYGDLEIFSGRKAEHDMLNVWLENKTENLLIIRALGGFGKSALTWEWLKNKVDRNIWNRGVWWSFYEKESGFESFLSETLTYFGMQTKEHSARQQVNDLLDLMRKNKLLIILDGFERLLRQYGNMNAAYQAEDNEVDLSQRDCTSQVVEIFLLGLSDKTLQSKVLLTTRLTPRILEGNDGKLYKSCREEPLESFKPEDAVEYFHAEGIKGARAEIEAACSVYGYHPLSLSLLAGLINQDHENPGDILVAKQHEIFGDIKAKRAHILQRAYDSLKPERKELLSKLSCFRGSIEFSTIKTIFANADLENSLKDLCNRGLLQYVKETHSYDMHPLVRRYAYERLNITDRTTAHARLRDYFAIMDAPEQPETLDDMVPIIERYYHTVQTGELDQAGELFLYRIWRALYYQLGASQIQIVLLRALFVDGEDKPPRLKEESDQAQIMNELANAYVSSIITSWTF